jgi:ABC-type thiamin/hydroxymethylpyrimidine transport system permease subunit
MQMLKQLGMWILQGIVGLAFIVGGAVFLVEYMAGCGETYKDSKGRTHQNECMFIR